MIATPSPDTWVVDDDLDAMATQLRGRPDARQHQQLRRHHRTGAQHDLATMERLDATRPFDLDRDGAAAVEHHPAHADITLDRQVRTVAVGRHVGERGIDARPADDVAWQAAAPWWARRVLVGLVGVPETRGRRGKRAAQRMQRLGRYAGDRHRSGAAVVRTIGEIEVVLEPLEERHDLGKRPFVVPKRGPGVEIVDGGAHEHPSVHGARSAHHLATRHRHDLRLGQPGIERPVGDVPCDRTGHRRRIEQLRRRAWRTSKIAAGFHQQHRPIGVLAEPRCQGTPGRAGADDHDVVVVHADPILRTDLVENGMRPGH